MKHVLQSLLVSVCCVLLNDAVGAQRLDDSASPRNTVQAQVFSESGQLLKDDSVAKYAIMKFGRLDYRLNTAAYVGQNVTLYYVVPAVIQDLTTPSALTVDWVGNGELATGSLHAGERKAVWSGVVPDVWFDATLDLTISIELAALQSAGEHFGIESYFEIEAKQ